MNTSMKIFIVIMMIFGLFACGKKDEKIAIERDGTLYEVANQVSFYYPKDFELDINNENQKDVRFVKNNEMYSYATVIDDTDNILDELPQLYEGQLEEDGAIHVQYAQRTIPSGIECYEFTGVYQASGMKFMQMVYFTDEASYIYAYQAPENIYDENKTVVSQYLQSLTVHH